MVVDRSRRRCLLCDRQFDGRAFVCRQCADRYRDAPIPADVLQTFYVGVDTEYPDWANTYGNYNPPEGILGVIDRLDRSIRILEVGAGGGFLLEELSSRGFENVLGSDITVTSIAEMSRRNRSVSVVAADAEALPFKSEEFDVIITSDVIEHIPRVNRHLSEVHRILKPGGRYLVKTPNRWMAETYYRVRDLYDYHIWHPSMFTANELSRALAGYGFSSRFLSVESLTGAQVRKIPTGIGRKLASRFPLRRLPPWLRPHLEVEAVKTAR